MIKTHQWADKFALQLANPAAVKAAAGICVFAVVTAVAAHVRIPLPFSPVPLTAQTAAVLLAGATLGAAGGAASQILYMLLGLLGLPVFAAGGAALLGPTAGYIIGFIPAAAVVGLATRRGFRLATLLPAMVVATAIIYTLGVAGLMTISGLSLRAALLGGVVPFLAGDSLKVAAVVGVSRFTIPLRRQQGHSD